MNKTVQLLQKIWLDAFREGEVRIELRDKKEADRFRFKLYDAVKHAKKSLSETPLKEAAVNCQITYAEPHVLLVTSIVKDDLMQRVAAQRGINLESLQPHLQGELSADQQLELDAQASLEKTMRRLAGEDLPISSGEASTSFVIDPADIPFRPSIPKPRRKLSWDEPGKEGLEAVEYDVAIAKWFKGEDWR